MNILLIVCCSITAVGIVCWIFAWLDSCPHEYGRCDCTLGGSGWFYSGLACLTVAVLLMAGGHRMITDSLTQQRTNEAWAATHDQPLIVVSLNVKNDTFKYRSDNKVCTGKLWRDDMSYRFFPSEQCPFSPTTTPR